MHWLLSDLGVIPAISFMIWVQAHPRTLEKRGDVPEDVGMLSMQALQLVHFRLPQTHGGILLTQRRHLLLGSPCTLLCST